MGVTMFRDPNDRQQINALMEMLAEERERCARAEGIADQLREQLVIAQNNFEWARVRLNQVEAERAHLITHVLKLPLTPMVIERAHAPEPRDTGVGMPFDLDGISFDDMGDDAARRAGISHEN